MSDELEKARDALLEQLQEASRGIPDWGRAPNPVLWLAAIEAFVDAKIRASASGESPP